SQLSKLTGGKPNPGADWLGQVPSVTIPPEMPASLVDHILHCWSNPAHRRQDRKRLDVEVEACIGLIDCHYHLCGNVEFDQFIHPKEDVLGDSFLSGGFDALIASMSGKKDFDSPKASRQTVFRVILQNISSGGYCIF